MFFQKVPNSFHNKHFFITVFALTVHSSVVVGEVGAAVVGDGTL